MRAQPSSLLCAFIIVLLAAQQPQVARGLALNPRRINNRCEAYDIKDRFDFSEKKGLTFAWYEPTLRKSFSLRMCSRMEMLVGDITTLDVGKDRFNSNVQGRFSEFTVERRFSKGEVFDNPRTWTDSSVAYMQMRYTHGSNAPPCHFPLDRSAGNTKFAPDHGGRSATVNVFCGGCPNLSPGSRNKCNKYLKVKYSSKGVIESSENYGQPRKIDPFTAEVVKVTDQNACICSTEQTSLCHYTVNMTMTCPSASIAFNQTKRALYLMVTVIVMSTIVLLWTFFHFSSKAAQTGRQYVVVNAANAAVDAFRENGAAFKGLQQIGSMFSNNDILPDPPSANKRGGGS